MVDPSDIGPNAPNRRNYAFMRAMIACCDSSDCRGVETMWDGLDVSTQIWLMNEFDRVNVEKVNRCIQEAIAMPDPRYIDPLPLEGETCERQDERK